MVPGREGEVVDVLDATTVVQPGIFWADITFYSCTCTTPGCTPEGYCGATASRVRVAPGMVACFTYWPFTTRFRISGDPLDRWLVCTDRGSAVVNRNHLDVFFWTAEEGWAWLQEVGTRAEVEVLR